MFNKLRNKIVIFISLLSAVILFVTLCFTYLYVSKSLDDKLAIPNNAPSYTTELNNIISDRIVADRSDSLNDLMRSLIYTGLLIEVIVIILSYLLSSRIIRPVKNNYEKERQFVANASHEIKTPIAAIQANLEAADISGNIWIDNISFEATKLANLNTSLLTLAKIDTNQKKNEPTKFSPKSYVIKSVNSLKSRLFNKEIKISCIDSDLTLNRPDFEQIFNILFDNAIKYSDKNISIRVSQKTLKIINDGKKIPEEKIPFLFDRFYQVDKNSDGIGLGLSIAKALTDRNDWKLTASSDDKNTTFELTF